ncbi:MAG TPA: SAM-dependent methyltransferase, partial [Xanthobacteraceae bacterium]|nr:SAM-dependent methyltransferase [Xanthobacteraceae bacterium]
GLDDAGRLVFALSPMPTPHFESGLPPGVRSAPLGAVFEVRGDGVASELCRRLAIHGGAALIVDYGHAKPAFGDTLQAVKNHEFVGVLEAPGEADITAHVDFAALAAAARRAGLQALGPLPQGAFLRGLGIGVRAARLKASASPEQAARIDAAVQRLTGAGRENMGELFKVLALANQALRLESPIE